MTVYLLLSLWLFVTQFSTLYCLNLINLSHSINVIR